MIETIELYGGDVKLEFDSGRHQYRVVKGGRRFKVPSVTRITSIIDKSGPLVNWAINNTNEVWIGSIFPGQEYSETYLGEVARAAKQASRGIKEGAASKGTAIHKAIEECLGGGTSASGLSPIAEAAVVWLRGEAFRPESFERRIYSRQHRYSGTLDLLATDSEAKIVLIDWKTGKSVYPEFRLQTAAYVAAYEEETGVKIDRRIIVRLSEDGVEPHVYPRSLLRKDLHAFLGAKALFEQLQLIEKEEKKHK